MGLGMGLIYNSSPACLVAKTDEMLTTGRVPFPAERTLLVCDRILESCLTSRHQQHQRLETSHLDVRYRAPGTVPARAGVNSPSLVPPLVC
jgi:hypothetical protein